MSAGDLVKTHPNRSVTLMSFETTEGRALRSLQSVGGFRESGHENAPAARKPVEDRAALQIRNRRLSLTFRLSMT